MFQDHLNAVIPGESVSGFVQPLSFTTFSMFLSPFLLQISKDTLFPDHRLAHSGHWTNSTFGKFWKPWDGTRHITVCLSLFVWTLLMHLWQRGWRSAPTSRTDICQPFIWSSGSEGKWPLDRWRSWTSLGSAERQKEKRPFKSISISVGLCELTCLALLWKVPFLSCYMLLISGLGGSVAGTVVTGWAWLVGVVTLTSRFVSAIFSSVLVPAIILG